MAIAEMILGAVLWVVLIRLTSQQVINLFRQLKFDHSLVDSLKTLMLAIAKILLDTELKQMTNPEVKELLDDFLLS